MIRSTRLMVSIAIACLILISPIQSTAEIGPLPREHEIRIRIDVLRELIAHLEGAILELEEELLMIGTGEETEEERTFPLGITRIWNEMEDGWQHRSGMVQPFSLTSYLLFVEVKRTGPPVSSAIMIAYIFDENGRLIGTGEGVLPETERDESEVVQFIVKGDRSEARSYRLELKYEGGL